MGNRLNSEVKGDQIPSGRTTLSADNRLRRRCHADIAADANVGTHIDAGTDGNTGAAHQYPGAYGHAAPRTHTDIGSAHGHSRAADGASGIS